MIDGLLAGYELFLESSSLFVTFLEFFEQIKVVLLQIGQLSIGPLFFASAVFMLLLLYHFFESPHLLA